ncbi:MAG: LysR family transcriptional regulator, partial [Sphingomonadales bacterium]|nr:LysR family transcriptional regulator [Sphingomonadales bacterium]
MRRLPPLRALEAFVRVVRLGSAKAAANELGLSPSALSRRVQALEDFTGKRLFIRQHQALKLTEDGQAFYEAVSPKLEELAEAVESQVDTGLVLRLHLGVPSLFGGQRLFPRLPELRNLHPRLHIDIDTSPH